MHADSLEKKVCVIMPAYNEAASVGEVIQKIRRYASEADIVVVNDGSTDGTRRAALQAGAKALELPINLGIGGAVQTGLKYAYRRGCEIAVEVDADGQHDPRHIPQLVDKVVSRKADMAIGSRFYGNRAYHSSWLRMLGIRIFSQLIRLVTGRKIYDSTSGFRAYSRPALAFLSRRYPADFPEPESIVMLLNAGFKVEEVPTSINDRQAGESVVGGNDFTLRAAYFVVSNAIAILVSGLKAKKSRVS